MLGGNRFVAGSVGRHGQGKDELLYADLTCLPDTDASSSARPISPSGSGLQVCRVASFVRPAHRTMTSCSPSRALCLVLTLSSVFNANALVSPQSRRRAVVSSHLTSSSQLFAKDEPSASRYDLAVLGGGIVGVQAALVAKQQNKDRNVVLIDAPKE